MKTFIVIDYRGKEGFAAPAAVFSSLGPAEVFCKREERRDPDVSFSIFEAEVDSHMAPVEIIQR
jgi:hypothetical protein